MTGVNDISVAKAVFKKVPLKKSPAIENLWATSGSVT